MASVRTNRNVVPQILLEKEKSVKNEYHRNGQSIGEYEIFLQYDHLVIAHDVSFLRLSSAEALSMLRWFEQHKDELEEMGQASSPVEAEIKG